MQVKNLIKQSIKRILNSILGVFKLEIIAKHPDMVLYEYGSYDEYKNTQINFNKKKIEQIWADEFTLNIIASRIYKELADGQEVFGICHGSRNGFEQKFFSKNLNGKILGTDISDTAKDYEDTVHWDFHDPNPEWAGKCDFIYTNSLDQSWKPKQALQVWLNQLNSNGL
jgi:hypothetical protein